MYLVVLDFFYTLYTYEKARKRPGLIKYVMRPICSCEIRPAAVNYKKNGRIYYRSLCNVCLKHGAQAGIARWYKSGYRLKSQCDKCGFKSPHKEVFRVFHVDGDLNNCRPANLKTVCANCSRVLHKEGVRWRQGDLVPDL
jgi:hypothetical protein